MLCMHCYSWLSLLEGTRWLQHMSGLLRAAVTVASAIERDGRPVLVHCSDGWDRTPQIVALAQILLDPYYRTMEVRPQYFDIFIIEYTIQFLKPGISNIMRERMVRLRT